MSQPAHEFTSDVKLRDGGPVGKGLDAFADVGILENVDGFVVVQKLVENLHHRGEKPHWGILRRPFMKSTTWFLGDGGFDGFFGLWIQRHHGSPSSVLLKMCVAPYGVKMALCKALADFPGHFVKRFGV